MDIGPNFTSCIQDEIGILIDRIYIVSFKDISCHSWINHGWEVNTTIEKGMELIYKTNTKRSYRPWCFRGRWWPTHLDRAWCARAKSRQRGPTRGRRSRTCRSFCRWRSLEDRFRVSPQTNNTFKKNILG